MATAVLKMDKDIANIRGFNMVTTDPGEAITNIKQSMTFSRDAPPPQLPQIPGEVWAHVWDICVECGVADLVGSVKLMKMLPYALCICCCGPCIVIPKMIAFNMEQAKRWSDMLAEAKPMLAPYNIGVSIEQGVCETRDKDGHRHQRTVIEGLRFDGAGAMPGQMAMERPMERQQPRTRGLSSQPTAMVPSEEPSEKTGQWRHFSTPFGEYDLLKPFAHTAEEASDDSSEES